MSHSSGNRPNSSAPLPKLFAKWRETIKKEWAKTLIEILVSALGFLLALIINTRIAEQQDHDTYKSMLTAIHTEAEINRLVLDESYSQFYPRGIVLKEFSLSTTQQLLANPLFIKHARTDDLNMFVHYVRDLSLANSYRRITEQLELTGQRDEAWSSEIDSQWDRALKASKQDVDSILHFSEYPR